MNVKVCGRKGHDLIWGTMPAFASIELENHENPVIIADILVEIKHETC
jgi:hypothetical protein